MNEDFKIEEIVVLSKETQYCFDSFDVVHKYDLRFIVRQFATPHDGELTNFEKKLSLLIKKYFHEKEERTPSNPECKVITEVEKPPEKQIENPFEYINLK